MLNCNCNNALAFSFSKATNFYTLQLSDALNRKFAGLLLTRDSRDGIGSQLAADLEFLSFNQAYNLVYLSLAEVFVIGQLLPTCQNALDAKHLQPPTCG